MCMGIGEGEKKASEIPTAVGAGSKYAWILTSLLMAQKWNKYEKLRFFDKRHSSAKLRAGLLMEGD
jgi:hypothetical protein